MLTYCETFTSVATLLAHQSRRYARDANHDWSNDMVKHKDESFEDNRKRDSEPDANRDPITGTPGAHPLGVGAGAATGGMAGAAVGAIGGPIGAGIGAAVGAVAGGLIGKGAAQAVNPTVEDEYW